MEKLIFRGSQPIRTESLNLVPGEAYNVSDLSNDYLRSLKAQGLFETAELPAESEEQVTPEAKVDDNASAKSNRTPKPKQ